MSHDNSTQFIAFMRNLGYEGPLNIEDVSVALENDEFQLSELVKSLSNENIVTDEELERLVLRSF